MEPQSCPHKGINILDTPAKPGYSVFASLLFSVCLGADRRKIPVGIFTSYLDDSGHPKSSGKALVVAGFVATAHQWISFDGEWREILKEFGARSFHMKLFAPGAGEFKGWDRPRRKKFLAAFIKAAKKLPKSFSCGVLLDRYNEANRRYWLKEFLGGCG